MPRGLVPRFTDKGFINPPQVSLIQAGRFGECLVTPRSGREYGVEVNSHSEYPGSLDLAPGEIIQTEVLETLDTGLYINNLWYCNFSDRNDCRITGMTRFACFWVDKGEIRYPVKPMRFDQSVYSMLGDDLIGLTQEREFILDASTYDRRSTSTMHLPGVLVDNFRFTL